MTGGAVTDDAVLGGALRLLQPRRGHRVGHDAILLAAATPARAGDRAVDLGAGAGAAGLALARRVEGLDLVLVEIDPELARLATENAARNGLSGRVKVICGDVTALGGGKAAGGGNGKIAPGTADCVLMNPPFREPGRDRVSAEPRRRLAHAGGHAVLAEWACAAHRLLRPDGAVSLIWPADGLPDALAALAPFGAFVLLPVHPRAGAAAIRILLTARKGSRARTQVLPGLVLADERGRPSAAAEAVLRGGAALPPATLDH